MENMMFAWIAGIPLVALLVLAVVLAVLYRRVVNTNMVHIVQRGRSTIPYGTGLAGGNVYYRWPSWIPHFGVTVIELPVSNFDLSLHDYEAYDVDKVPFMADVTAFFRIADTTLAAQRVENVRELEAQLLQVVQGAVRKVLAGDKVETIMLERSKFGEAFTLEVQEQLKQWGVESVKSMELMDIRDGRGSQVISDIMARKTSHIAMESRREVAENNRAAEMAEIEAKREVDIQRQQAEQAVGQRTAEKEQAVGIAQEQSRQEVLTQERETKNRSMEVVRVEQVKRAEIARDEAIVVAEQTKQTTVIVADGELEAQRRDAQGIEVVGNAKAAAEQAMQMAPVEAKIALAKEIGTNPAFQAYLQVIEAVAAQKEIGIAQAAALVEADLKIIANTGDVSKGAGLIGGVLSSQGGTNLAAALEAMANTPMGQGLLSKLGISAEQAAQAIKTLPEAETPKVEASEEKPQL